MPVPRSELPLHSTYVVFHDMYFANTYDLTLTPEEFDVLRKVMD